MLLKIVIGKVEVEAASNYTVPLTVKCGRAGFCVYQTDIRKRWFIGKSFYFPFINKTLCFMGK